MKTPKLVLSVLACSVVVGNYAQNIPTHAPYVELLPTKEMGTGSPPFRRRELLHRPCPHEKTFREHGNTGRSHHDARPQIQYVDADGYIRHLLAIATAICIRRR